MKSSDLKTNDLLCQLVVSYSDLPMRWLANFNLLPDTFLLEFVTHQSYEFLYGANQGKARFKRLPSLLDNISIFSKAYQDFERAVSQKAHAVGVKAQDMADLSEWPDFKW